jgi:MFS family permease
VIPRLRPENNTLVRANARVSLAGTLAGLTFGVIGAGIVAATNSQWALRLAAFIFAGGAILALRLPGHADSPEGEQPLRSIAMPRITRRPNLGTLISGVRRGLGPKVIAALRINAALRFYTGFMTLFVAFLCRTHDFGPPHNLALGFFAIAAGGAGVIGTVLGARTRGRTPPSLMLIVLGLVTGLSFVAGLLFGLSSIILVAVGAGIAQTIAKLGLDSTIQETVAEEVRTSAFARSETILQMAFVVGGAVGLLPVAGEVGFIAAGCALALVFFDSLRHRALWRTT